MLKIRKKSHYAKYLLTVSLCALSVFCSINPAYARTYDNRYEEPDSSTRADVTINITSPELYEGTLEFYCGLETFYINIKSGETLTSVTYNVPKGVNKIGFLDPNDLGNSFTLSYNNQLNTEEQSVIDVVIDYSESTTEDDIVFDGEDRTEVVEIVPAEYDFSDGQEYGTVTISCKQYGSIDAVVYELMGNKVYDITLDAEHGFKANVYLPVGSYKELTAINVTPNELATVTSDLSFAWGHKNNEKYFGNNYDVTSGSLINIDDLYIKMNYQGDLREVDDVILLQTKIRNNYTEMTNERRTEFLENEFSDVYPTIAETSAPEIAEATEVEENNHNKIIIFGVIAFAVVIAAGFVILIRKKKED